MIFFYVILVFYFTWDQHFYNVCPFVFGSWCWLVSVFLVPLLYFNAGIYVVTLSADCFVPCLLVSLFVTKFLVLIFAFKSTEKTAVFYFPIQIPCWLLFVPCCVCFAVGSCLAGWFVVLVGLWCWLVRVLVGSCFLSKVYKIWKSICYT